MTLRQPSSDFPAHSLRLEHHGYWAGERRILQDVAFHVTSGEWQMILLDDGAIVGDGPTIEVLSVETIKRVFRAQERFSRNQEHGVSLPWDSV